MPEPRSIIDVSMEDHQSTYYLRGGWLWQKMINWVWFFPSCQRAQLSMSRMIGTCDSANADPLPRVAGYVRPKRVADDVDLATRHVIILLECDVILLKGQFQGINVLLFPSKPMHMNNITVNMCVQCNRKLCESSVVEHKYYFCEIF
jgi:hypothetical protein